MAEIILRKENSYDRKSKFSNNRKFTRKYEEGIVDGLLLMFLIIVYSFLSFSNLWKFCCFSLSFFNFFYYWLRIFFLMVVMGLLTVLLESLQE